MTIRTKLWTVCRAFARQDDANTTTEYTVMVAIIIVGLFAALSPFSDRLDAIYGRIDAELAIVEEVG